MTLTPRYDLKAEDPLSLKPVLADIFNQTLAELWLNSQFKDKVAIGIHDLDCTGGIREARYRDIRSQRYDGVHLYGPSGKKAYTISVIDILKSADILDQTDGQILSGQEFYKKLWQFQYQKKKHNRRGQNSNMNRARPASANDKDTRHNSNFRRQDRYSVPTSNLFEHLNW